ncbi:MAG: purine-nucleoside phosphorylase [Ignavibacteria bacterium]|nr:purine-nucleoside phosphorylase [Ignavibacteria bacterium]
MGEQLDKIIQSSDFIRSNFPKGFKPEIALITENDSDIIKEFKIISEIDFSQITDFNQTLKKIKGKVLFAKIKGNDVIIYNGRYHFYDGVSMRDIGHTIYVLKYLGIKKIISVEEVGHLNPRFNCGEIALIYDHINLMGDNPLIGKNENELGLRFPDMSNAYDKELHDKAYEVIQSNMLKVNDAVLLGTTGPQSETDAEARFYRDIAADILGYSIVPENITAIHCGIKFIGIGLITRELVADKMMEDERSEKEKLKEQKESLKKAEKKLGKIMQDIIKNI